MSIATSTKLDLPKKKRKKRPLVSRSPACSDGTHAGQPKRKNEQLQKVPTFTHCIHSQFPELNQLKNVS